MGVAAYDAVPCDIDGVLRRWPPADDVETAHGLPVGALGAAAFAPARLHPAITGRITDEQWRRAVAEDLARVCGSIARASAAVAAWSALPAVVNTAATAPLRRVRGRVPVAPVSNATTRLAHDLEQLGLAQLADVVVNTARIGVAKPDPASFTSPPTGSASRCTDVCSSTTPPSTWPAPGTSA